ncbi:MAG: hypothetical protein J6W52_12085 [Bacteroidaceae bacterium]|nr:hypothetical protein [Bacteroidaceae bacterium]
MTALAQKVKSTPMAPYIGVMQGMSRRDIDIVVSFLNEIKAHTEEPAEASVPIGIVEMVRRKFNVPESPETRWLLKHAVPADWDKQKEWDNLSPEQRAFAKRLNLGVEDMDERTVGLLIKYA